ncbi:YfiR family protein [Ectothiorhodospira shaposhnikovii]|uniref:YfiR family protein n=1 Tax=Ectothiorhodospira shaposhnikovii TaxID=1054 RepID=UPI001902D5FA|nr:YfiR family protein [Ectothiorhodospira shaposhnikovii]
MKSIARLALISIIYISLSALSLAENPTEYRLKAAFLYNFALFTEWPEQVGNTLNLCIYGLDPFGEDLIMLDHRQVGHRWIITHRVSTLPELPDCQVVFISRSAISQLPHVLSAVQGSPVLTVADSPGAMRQGVALNMVRQHNRIAFEANLSAARAQGLSLSSRLLRLATEVEK